MSGYFPRNGCNRCNFPRTASMRGYFSSKHRNSVNGYHHIEVFLYLSRGDFLNFIQYLNTFVKKSIFISSFNFSVSLLHFPT